MQEMVKVIEMLCLVGPSYQDIIDIKTNSEDSLVEVVHHPLKDRGGRCHAKQQPIVPKQSLVGAIVRTSPPTGSADRCARDRVLCTVCCQTMKRINHRSMGKDTCPTVLLC